MDSNEKNMEESQLELKDELKLIYDHYRESCSLRKEAQQRRNKSFVLLCILEAIAFLLLIQSDAALGIFEKGINSALGTALSLGSDVLQTLLWIMITYVLMWYCQDTLYVERQYKYEGELEKEISGQMKRNPFEKNSINREGENYLKDYPMVLNFIDLFYKMFSPLLFIIINSVRIVKEWMERDLSLSLICDTAIFIMIFIITYFFFFEIHSKITQWCKKHIPLVNTAAKWLRKVLKKV